MLIFIVRVCINFHEKRLINAHIIGYQGELGILLGANVRIRAYVWGSREGDGIKKNFRVSRECTATAGEQIHTAGNTSHSRGTERGWAR